MDKIFKSVSRHFVFIVLSLVSLYLMLLTIGAKYNYFSWAVEHRVFFGIMSNVVAVVFHAYWYENRNS